VTGVVLGLLGGLGLWLAVDRVAAMRRPDFEARVLRHLPDLPHTGLRPDLPRRGVVDELVGPVMRGAARRLESVAGGSASISRRLQRADLDLSLADFRVQQVVWGLTAFAVTSVGALLVASRAPGRAVPLAVLCAVAFVTGVLLRENRLTAQVRRHERDVLTELPAVAELMALAVAAGEGPVAALERVVRRSRGALAGELTRVLSEVRTGTPVARALDDWSCRTGVAPVARFANGLAVALERGTPLADVLHAQAGDVREAQRRELIESGARREVFMMVPVVFLVLPTTVMFAFWPGVVGLRLTT
jgi:tight adherence protein C